jgi:short-subunit dehydrogenase
MARRAALVTGGSRGIGLAVARTLCDEGYSLTLVARNVDRLAVAAEELSAHGADVQVISGDLSDEATVRETLVAHRSARGRLDVLVNNAGTGIGQPLAEIATRRMDLQLALNVRAAMLCYREAADLLLAAGGEHGRAWVVNICSRAAVEPQPWLSVYSATKAAMLAFSVAMNRELSPSGVRSCAICPGRIATELTRSDEHDGSQLLEAGDVAEVMRLLLRLSPGCQVEQVVLEGESDRRWRPPTGAAQP